MQGVFDMSLYYGPETYVEWTAAWASNEGAEKPSREIAVQLLHILGDLAWTSHYLDTSMNPPARASVDWMFGAVLLCADKVVERVGVIGDAVGRKATSTLCALLKHPVWTRSGIPLPLQTDAGRTWYLPPTALAVAQRMIDVAEDGRSFHNYIEPAARAMPNGVDWAVRCLHYWTGTEWDAKGEKTEAWNRGMWQTLKTCRALVLTDSRRLIEIPTRGGLHTLDQMIVDTAHAVKTGFSTCLAPASQRLLRELATPYLYLAMVLGVKKEDLAGFGALEEAGF